MCLCKTQICASEKQKPVDAEDKLWYDIRVGAVFRPVFAGSARWQCVTDPGYYLKALGWCSVTNKNNFGKVFTAGSAPRAIKNSPQSGNCNDTELTP